MRYGLPYMGSKNSIVPFIIQALPPAENFYDLFAGGCAITHGAMLTNKWKTIIINDINCGITKLFIDAINGKYNDEKRWISREDFFKLKDTDPYVAYCWSFGNRAVTYLYGAYIEPWKKALHYARVLNDRTLLHDMGIDSDGSKNDIEKHAKEYASKYCAWFKKVNEGKPLSKVNQIGLKKLESLQSLKNLKILQRLQRLQSLESLQRLQSLERLPRLQSLQRYCVSYEQFSIKPNSVVYCDIPYEDTAKYISGSFDHKAFYDWACKQKELVVISSYKISDDRFMEINCIKKYAMFNLTNDERKQNYEKLFIPKHQKELYEKMMKRKIREVEHYEQLKLF